MVRRSLVVAVALAFATAACSVAAQSVTASGDVSPAGIGPGNTTVAGTITIGTTATGSVSVLAGATLSGAAFQLGDSVAGIGNLTVGGTGSMARSDRGWTIGASGTGVLDVLSGATVVNGGNVPTGVQSSNFYRMIIARDTNSTGTVNVNGGTLLVEQSRGQPAIYVGLRSTGTLNVTNGGRVTINGNGVNQEPGAFLQVGSAPFEGFALDQESAPVGQGIVNVAGAGSVLELLGQNTAFNVGRLGAQGSGLVRITAEGRVDAGSALSIGRGNTPSSGVGAIPGWGATGVVEVDGAGSTLNVSGVRGSPSPANGAFIQLGREEGTGTLTVRNGARVTVDGLAGSARGGMILAGVNAGSRGTLSVESGALVEILGDAVNTGLSIGDLGSSGTLSVSGGARLTVTNSGTAAGGIAFGGFTGTAAGGSFSGSISGTGSEIEVTGLNMTMTVGRNTGSSGTVAISGGARVAPGGGITVGHLAGSSGTLNVSGTGTTLAITSNAADDFGARLTVGRAGVGTATVAGGAQVMIDGTAGTQGSGIFVGGSGTAGGGTGTLTVTGNGTSVTVQAQSELLTIGRVGAGTTPSNGTVIISDGSEVLFGAAARGSVGFTAGSTGTLTVSGAGSRLAMGTFLGVGRNTNDNPGGTGLLTVLDGGLVQATTIHNGATGTITGNGTLEGNVVNDGTITPGASPGRLVVTGSLTLGAGSVLTMEIGGTGEGSYDQILVGGTTTLGGVLRLVLVDGYTPQVGHSFRLFGFDGAVGGAFDSVALDGFGPGVSFDSALSSNALTLQVAAVPEPHEYALLLAGLGVVAWGARRRRAK